MDAEAVVAVVVGITRVVITAPPLGMGSAEVAARALRTGTMSVIRGALRVKLSVPAVTAGMPVDRLGAGW